MAALTEEINELPKELSDPFADFIKQGADQITRSANGIAARYFPELTAANANEYAAVMCCVVNSAYDLLGRDLSAYETIRAVQRSDFVKWLRVLREMLVVVRDLSGTQSSEFDLGILKLDISATIQASLDQAIAGPLVAAMVSFEWATTKLGERVLQAIAKTKCLPLIEMWGAILQWLYSGRAGFMRTARGFISDVFARITRTLRLGNLAAGDDQASRIDSELKFDKRRIQMAIDVLDAILTASTLLTTCRLSDPRSTTPTTPGTDENGPGDDAPTLPAPDEPDTSPNIPGPGGNGGTGSTGQGPATTGTGATGGYIPTITPEGYVDPSNLPEGDYVYLTPENIEYVLLYSVGLTPDVAATVIGGRACRDSLTAETEQALVQLGILIN